MAYGIHELELTGLQVKTILSVHITHKPGEHGNLELTADMGEQNMDWPIHETESGQAVSLFVNRKGQRELLFSGIIINLTAQSMGKSCYVTLQAKTWSYRMDIKKKSRSFQDTSMSYGELVKQIVAEYPGAECQMYFSDAPLGEIAVQYQETDWQFIKRILSMKNIPFVCSETRENLSLYAGVAQIPADMEVIRSENVWKDTDELTYWKKSGQKVTDTDFIIYQLQLNHHIGLYSVVSHRGKELTAGNIEYKTVGSTVYEFVHLQKKAGILQRNIYPMQLVGTALEGSIINVAGENVQIHLKIDDNYASNDCYWFPFSTPSASSDGSGWYYMPEMGDKVRVYFPSKATGEVIAISAVSSYEAPAAPKKWSGIETKDNMSHIKRESNEVVQEELVLFDGAVDSNDGVKEFVGSGSSENVIGDTLIEEEEDAGEIAGLGNKGNVEEIMTCGSDADTEEIASLGNTYGGYGRSGEEQDETVSTIVRGGKEWTAEDLMFAEPALAAQMFAEDEINAEIRAVSSTGKTVAGAMTSTMSNIEQIYNSANADTSSQSKKRDFSSALSSAFDQEGENARTAAADALKQAEEDKMGDSAVKYLRTIDGQEVSLSPKGIVVRCGGDTAKVEVLKSGKINLYAQKGITISADIDIYVKAKESMNIRGGETVLFKSYKGGSMELDIQGKLKIKGTEVHVN